jgi:arylsulfatase A-like enzyme
LARRRGLYLLALAPVLAAFGVALWWHGRETGQPGRAEGDPASTLEGRPNLLLVVYDARRPDDFSFGPFGNQRGDTPFLARFKDDALYFPVAVSPGCWTVPVHASMFTGLSVCELGNDIYSPGFQSFTTEVKSLAEILRASGYRTIAFPDHPLFYAGSVESSLIRGFELYSVVNDSQRLGILTDQGPHLTHPLDEIGPERDMTPSELGDAVRRFNSGEIRFDLDREADLDRERGIRLAPLGDLFRASPYFRLRYGSHLDRFFDTQDGRPFFMFLNLHMATIFYADHPLYSRWLLRTLMMTAQARGVELTPARSQETARQALTRNFEELGLPVDILSKYGPLKQVFDNRFYDAAFQALFEDLVRRGLAENTLTVVASDHGMSFSEHGERGYLHTGALPNEYIVRVPLILRFPGAQRRLHGINEHAVSLTDLFPTLLELGVGRGAYRRERPVRGTSLVERVEEGRYEPVLVTECALQPGEHDAAPDRAAYVKAFHQPPLKLVYAPQTFEVRTDKSWPFAQTLLATPGLRESGKLELLYDVEADPGETINLAEHRPDVVARLKETSPGPWTCASAVRAGVAKFDDAALDTLRALGYVE